MTSSFVISMDFELHWGVFDHTRPAAFRDRMVVTRAVIPKVLELFELRGISATWAVVGALLCESKEELLARMPPPPKFHSQRFGIAPFMHEIGENEASSPMHFAPTLVRQILSTTGQELGTHTFTHLYTLETGVIMDDIRSDLLAVRTIADDWNIKFDSIVFPRNQYNSEILRECEVQGFKTFRGGSAHWAYRANDSAKSGNLLRRGTRLADAFVPITPAPTVRRINKLTDVPATLFLRPDMRRPVLGNFIVNRIKAGMTEAAQKGGIFHLWWYPHNFGVDSERCMRALAEILRHYQRLHEEYGMESRTMGSFGSNQ